MAILGGSSSRPRRWHHVEHIYAKIDASTRAAAGLLAMRHGLLPEAAFVFTEAAVPARLALSSRQAV
jgi:hypothetical protein